jgi:HAD superfamily hydrolase (TIGR01509 family)
MGRNSSLNRAILFDLDGVLIDSMGSHASTWCKAVKTHLNIDIPEAYFFLNEGRNAKAIVSDLIQKNQLDVDENTWQVVSDYCDQLFLEDFTPRLVDGARDLVMAVHSYGYRLGVATGSTRFVLNDMLSKTGMLGYFSAFVSADDVEFSKPHPQPYRLLLQQLQTSAECALVIENAPLGVDSAMAADLICLAVATTNEPDVLSHATNVFLTLDEIKKYLENEFSQTRGFGVWSLKEPTKEFHAS